MSVTTFIPKLWSDKLNQPLQKELIFHKLCNRKWEGELKEYGDSVHINTLTPPTVKPYTPGIDIDEPDSLSGTDLTLSINHGSYVNFCVNDVDRVQAKANLLDAATEAAIRSIAESDEEYIVSVIRSAAGIRKTVTVTSEELYDLIIDMKKELDTRHVPAYGRSLIMPIGLESAFLQDARYLAACNRVDDEALKNGCVAKALGFDIYLSSDLTECVPAALQSGEIIVMNTDSVAFVQQVSKVEAYRRENGFDEGIKALSLCGCKVYKPGCVGYWTITLSE